MRSLLFAIGFVAFFGLATKSQADSVVLRAVADTGLIQLEPNNNMGGHVFFNAGTTFNGHRNRGLLRFDPVNEIPAGSKIKSVQLVLEVVGVPTDEPAAANFQLYRMLRSWGEGDKVSIVGPGRGAPATEGEATWNARFALTINSWAAPGGFAGTDYSDLVSAEQFVYDFNNISYEFGSTSRMVADVQAWLDQPELNFGWMLKTEIEEVTTTARRFASREDHEYGPMLTVEFDPPPLLQVERVGSELQISFVTQPNQSYALQTATALDGSGWSVLTNIPGTPDAETVRWTNGISGDRAFFRVQVME